METGANGAAGDPAPDLVLVATDIEGDIVTTLHNWVMEEIALGISHNASSAINFPVQVSAIYE